MQEQMNLSKFKPVQDVSTRWNSSLMMLERLLVFKVPMTVALASLTNAEKNLEAEEWVVVEDAIQVLKPMLSMTEKLSGELYPTMSLIVPLTRGLQRAITKKRDKNSNYNPVKAIPTGQRIKETGPSRNKQTCGKSHFSGPTV